MRYGSTAVTPGTAATPSRPTRVSPGNRGGDDLLTRIRGEYLEMPGLALSLDQAQRLWNLPRQDCERVLDALVDAGFLACPRLGMFVRADVGCAGA